MATIAVGQYTITKIYDGDNGQDGKSAVVALLSNESHTLNANSSGVVSSYTGASTNITVYDGAADVTSDCIITKTESGIAGTLSGAVYTVTGVTNGVGGTAVFTIVYGEQTLTKTFSVSVAKAGATGSTGAPGKGIRSITLQYAKSTSSTVAPTTGWSATLPTRNAEEYLWIRDYIVYTDDSSENTGARCATGDKGDTGATGTSIVSVTSYFAISTSNSSTPISGWQTTMPTRDKGEYLWRKDYIVYSNGNAEYTTAVVISGLDGEDGQEGAAGKSIGTITNYYLATTASSNVTTSTSGWTVDIQNVTSTKKYLWNYEVIEYTDGTIANTSNPCIIGVYGDTGSKGDTGATGKGISSITEYYQVSTSNTTSPTSWVTSIPTMTTTNKYLWNYEVVTYTDKTTEETSKRVIGVYGNTGATGAAAKVCKINPSAQVFKSTTGAIGTFTPQYIYLYPTFQNCTYSKWQYSTDGTTWTDVTSGSHSMTIATYNSYANSLRIERTSDLYTSDNSSISFKCITNQSTTYDTVTIIKVYDVTELEIGGRNYWKNSSFNLGLESYKIVNNDGTISLDKEKFRENSVVKFDRDDAGNIEVDYVTEDTATGKNIHIEDSAEEPLVDIVVKGETKQETRSGKNILNVFSDEWVAYNSVRQADGSIKANIQDNYYSMLRTTANKWKEYFLNNAGKRLTFSVKESFPDYNLAIVIMGERTSTTLGYQSIENTKGERSVSIKIADDFTSISGIELRFFRKIPVEKFTDTTSVISELQLEEGSEATDYEPYGVSPSPDYPSEIENIDNVEINVTNGLEETDENYQSQTATFPLGEGEKLMEGSYLADDGIHHRRKQVVLTGEETITMLTYGENKRFQVVPANYNPLYDRENTKCLCNYFKADYMGTIGNADLAIEPCFFIHRTFIIFTMTPDTNITTVDEFKSYLSTKYANGTPIIVEYPLAEPAIVPYTVKQQEAWDRIKELHTYKNITNISSTTDLDIVYVRDNGRKLYIWKQYTKIKTI